MSVGVGTQLGYYEITALLGKGGMGEVYRARDTRLKRDVAIKILPDEFLRDAGRVTRFQREAEVLASLNHPNIAAIYDFQEANGTRFLVLELVEGETLAERIQRGPVQAEEALEIARHICEALEAAHEKGIVHRDLKPANVKVATDGRVKVLDFGLAKAMENAPVSGTLSNSPTLSLAATQAGMILGTAAYMSPEQAKGFEVDARSDMFSFGSVLYEMLCGRPPFQGDTVAEILASVLVRDADFNLLPSSLNPRIQELLQRCLQKNSKRRWQAAGDLRAELETIAKAPRAATAAAVFTVPQPPLWKRAIPILLTAILFSALAGIAGWTLKPAPPTSIGRFSMVLPENQNFTRTRSQVAAISPDGSMLAYVANRQLYLRRLSELEAQPIPGTQEDVSSPFFSPDSRSIAFYSFQDDAVKKVAVTGGAAVTLCSACANTLAYGMSWEGDTIAFARDAGREIVGMPQTGGIPQVLVKAEPDERISSPHLLAGGDRLMFSSLKRGTRWDKADIIVMSRRSGQRNVVLQGGSGARYVDTGHIVYSIGTNLLAVPFGIRQLKVTGDPVSIVNNVMRSPAFEDGPANFDVSKNGTLMYASGNYAIGDMLRVLAVIDKTGRATVIPGLPPGSYATPRVSPDGKYLAVETTDDGSIGVYELSGKSQLRRLTLAGANANPVWSPDGKRIAYRSNRDGKIGVFVQNTDGTGTAEQLTTEDSVQGYPFSWSPDGNYIVFVRNNRSWSIALSGERKVAPITEGPAPAGGQNNAAFSPDGRWIALASAEGTPPGLHIYVQQFPKGAKYQVSRELANAPMWSRDGKELFYYQTDARKLVSVRIETQPSFSVSEPVAVPLDGMIQPEGGIRQYDTLPDGKMLALRNAPQPGATEQRSQQRINVVLNWLEELKQRVPVK